MLAALHQAECDRVAVVRDVNGLVDGGQVSALDEIACWGCGPRSRVGNELRRPCVGKP